MPAEAFKADDPFAPSENLAEALSAERQARERAEAGERVKSDLLAVVSQEFRTPMGAVISLAELLLKSPLDPRQKRYAATLEQSARSLLTLLNDILDVSRLEAGSCELDFDPFDLHDLIKTAGNALQAQAEEKSLEGAFHVGMSCPRYVKGDARRLRQILTNLIGNAVKFTAKGSVKLHVNAGEADDKLTLRFDVVDTGIGLSEAQKQRLFQPGLQAGRGLAQGAAGVGLGLFIARRLVELMGGEIGCESVPGQGSLFWFTLPSERAPRATLAEAEIFGKLAGHVLVVEDNAVSRMLIAAYLQEFGLTYDMVANGAKALARLAGERYDLILMDIVMPELNGVEATKRIRRRAGPIAEIPIVALTAHARKGDRETYLAAGLDAYVTKPIRGSDLFAVLAAYLSEDEAEPHRLAMGQSRAG